MMNKVILDTNYIIALIDDKDKRAIIAGQLSVKLKLREAKAIYLDCVLNEVISVLGKRFEERKRTTEFRSTLKRLIDLVPKDKITWVYPEVPRLYEQVLKIIEKYKGKLNFHDGLIVAATKEMGIDCIVSFDEDFDEIPKLKRIGDILRLNEVLG